MAEWIKKLGIENGDISKLTENDVKKVLSEKGFTAKEQAELMKALNGDNKLQQNEIDFIEKLVKKHYNSQVNKKFDLLEMIGINSDKVKNFISSLLPRKAIPKVGKETKPFNDKTIKAMNAHIPTTNICQIARENLGLQEVTVEEFNKLPYDEQLGTQFKVIGKKEWVNDQWCAHTTSYLAEKAGMDIGGHKRSVNAFIEWGTNRGKYNPINTKEMKPNDYATERLSRELQLERQLRYIKEGDFIIWKSQYLVNVEGEGLKPSGASHIGVFARYDIASKTIYIYEGNANYSVNPEGPAERRRVKNKEEGKVGGQEIGEFQEVNNRDGLILKAYAIEELADFGYSGYIDNQDIVK